MTGAWLASAAWLLTIALFVSGFALQPWVVLATSGWLLPIALPFVTLGAFVAGKRPRNPIGWLLWAWGG